MDVFTKPCVNQPHLQQSLHWVHAVFLFLSTFLKEVSFPPELILPVLCFVCVTEFTVYASMVYHLSSALVLPLLYFLLR